MVLSYSAAAQPTASTPSVISIASPAVTVSSVPPTPASTTSSLPSAAQPSAGQTHTSAHAGPSKSKINHLILDAGPLLSLAPLRHLATTFHTTPLVLAELRDPKAREHWEMLKLSGVDVRVERPSAEAMAKGMSHASTSRFLAGWQWCQGGQRGWADEQ